MCAYVRDEQRVRRTNRAHRWWMVLVAVISAVAAGMLVLLAESRRAGRRSETRVVVTAGGSSYHRIDCRTIEGHEVRALTVEEARALGRSPSAICGPPA